MKTHISTT